MGEFEEGIEINKINWKKKIPNTNLIIFIGFSKERTNGTAHILYLLNFSKRKKHPPYNSNLILKYICESDVCFSFVN